MTVPIPEHDPVIFMRPKAADWYERHREACLALFGGDLAARPLRDSAYRTIDKRIREFTVRDTSVLPDPLEPELHALHAYKIVRGKQSCTWLTFANVAARSTYEAYVVRQGVIVDLNFDVGDVFIRPESVSDVVREWFNGIEVDFDEHPTFSRRYYALARNEERMRRGMPGEALELLGTNPGLLIRMLDRRAMIVPDEKLDPKVSPALVNLALSLGECER